MTKIRVQWINSIKTAAFQSFKLLATADWRLVKDFWRNLGHFAYQIKTCFIIKKMRVKIPLQINPSI